MAISRTYSCDLCGAPATGNVYVRDKNKSAAELMADLCEAHRLEIIAFVNGKRTVVSTGGGDVF